MNQQPAIARPVKHILVLADGSFYAGGAGPATPERQHAREFKFLNDARMAQRNHPGSHIKPAA